MRNKYKAQSVYYHLDLKRTISITELDQFISSRTKSLKAQNILYFASRYEYKVYQELVNLFGIENVICQASVLLYPPTQCCPNGKHWNIDFLVQSDKELKRPAMFVEAKGALTDRFLDSLVALETFNPNVFDSLYLLFNKAIPTNNKIINNLVNSEKKFPQAKIMLLRDFVESQSLHIERILAK